MFRQALLLPFRAAAGGPLKNCSAKQRLLLTSQWLSPTTILSSHNVFVFGSDYSIVPFRFYATHSEKPKLRYEQFYDHSKRDDWIRYAVMFFVGATAFVSATGLLDYFVDSRVPALKRKPAPKGARAKERVQSPSTSKEVSAADDDDEATGEVEEDCGCDEDSKKKRIGFRDRRIISYEDRIRAYSTPDKIFRYFATLQRVNHADGSTQILMTPSDFMRSITPGVKQVEGLGLDSFKRYDPLTDELKLCVSPDSVFYTLGDKALISFSDYIFLLTVLSTPPRQFVIAFRMFDLNSDGNLDIDEFRRVQSILREQTNVGKRHRDHAVTGSTLKEDMNTALATYFFGEDGKGTLNVNKMLEFQMRLQRELNRIEFNRYEPDSQGRITEVKFAQLLLTYAGFPEAKKRKMIKRVRLAYANENSQGITFQQYSSFSQLLKNITDVDTALTFYNLAGASINKDTFKHVAVSVAGVELDDHVVDVVFVLFDEDGDMHLSNKEFVSVMKHRLLRGLDKPMDTGAVRLLSAINRCVRERISAYWNTE